MLIRMRHTVLGSPDGIRTQAYQGGEVYDLPPNAAGDLAAVFVREGWATPVDESPVTERAVLTPVTERAVKPRGKGRG